MNKDNDVISSEIHNINIIDLIISFISKFILQIFSFIFKNFNNRYFDMLCLKIILIFK